MDVTRFRSALLATLSVLLLSIATVPHAATAGPSASTASTATASAATDRLVRLDPSDRLREARIQRQTIHLLTSSDPRAQEQALRMVIRYAHVDSFRTRFYRPLTPHLADVAENGSSEALQVMAVSALANVDTPTAMRHLAELDADATSERVQRMARRALLHHERKQRARKADRLARLAAWRDG